MSTNPAGSPSRSGNRKPQVFRVDDPEVIAVQAADAFEEPATPGSKDPQQPAQASAGLNVRSGLRWGALLVSALTAAASIAAALWFWRFVSVALERNDWIGWTVTGLIALAVLSGAVIVIREWVGFSRIGRLNKLRAALDAALRDKDVKAERVALARLTELYKPRAELKWQLARLAEHARDVHDAGALAALADRELMSGLDQTAKTLIAASAKRVATVTALSPIASLSIGFVLLENLRMLRGLAGIYGGRPGFAGSMRLARLVVVHLVASGSVALTDDLLGQFLGQDLVRRLSKRLGEGAFNGALTGRVGVAALELIRPLPFIEASPVRVRDVVAGVLKRTLTSDTKPDAKSGGTPVSNP
jgi:putative membrane protein